MTTIEEIKQQLNKAEVEYGEAKKKLDEFKEEGNVKMLKDLKDGLMEGKWSRDEKTKRETRRDKLEKEKERLEKNVDNWKDQVKKLQDALVDLGKGGGNEQIA